MDNLNLLLEAVERNAKKLKEAIDAARDEISFIRRRIDDLITMVRDNHVPTDIRKDTLVSTKEEAVLVLEKNAMDAIESTEFNIAYFKNDLLHAIRDEKTFIIRQTNFGKDVDVKINLNETAGTLSDYAEGVKAAREHFAGVQTPEQASKTWKYRLYKPAREGTRVLTTYGRGHPRQNTADRTEYHVALYWRTLNLRKLGSAKLAPWWGLIEWGNKEVSLKSDRGGTPYPTYGGEHFVQRSEKETIDYYYSTLNAYMEAYHDKLQERIDRLYSALRYWRRRLKELLEEQDHDQFEIVYNLTVDHLRRWYAEDRLSLITADMLDKVAQEVVAGRAPRIRLGRGAPRIRTSLILKKFNQQLKEMLG